MVDAVRSLTGGERCDSVVEAVGVQEAPDLGPGLSGAFVETVEGT